VPVVAGAFGAFGATLVDDPDEELESVELLGKSATRLEWLYIRL